MLSNSQGNQPAANVARHATGDRNGELNKQRSLFFISKSCSSFTILNAVRQSSLNLDILSLIRSFEVVRASMHLAISMNKTEVLDSVLNDFSEVKYREQAICD